MEFRLDDFNTVLTKAEGRDKLARFVQYFMRAVVGFSSKASPKAGTTLDTMQTHARTVMTQLAGARRTHRWCKELPVLQNLPKSLKIADPLDRFLDFFQKATLATFMMIDHVGHLKQWKILPGGKRSGSGTIQLGLKFFCLSNFIGLIVQCKKLFLLNRSQEDKSTEKNKCLETAFKHLLVMFQTSHLSLLYQTHDAWVGIAGMISSGMDFSLQWPAPKKAVNASPSPETKDKTTCSAEAKDKKQ